MCRYFSVLQFIDKLLVCIGYSVSRMWLVWSHINRAVVESAPKGQGSQRSVPALGESLIKI